MKKVFKIAHLGHKNVMTREGGVEVVVAELATRQVLQGHNVTCYNRIGHHVCGEEFDVAKVKTWNGIRMKYVPTIPLKGLAAVTSSFVATLLCAIGRYDIVHIHAEGPAFFSKILVLAKVINPGLRICWTCHGLDWKREKWQKGLGSKYILRAEQNIVRDADEIIVLNHCTQKYFRDRYNRQTVVIPNGVNAVEKVNTKIIKEKWGLEQDEYLLFLSRITPEKGLHYLIKAFNKVKTNKKLVIAGGKSDTALYENEMKELASNDRRIVFTGFVQGRELEELYSNAYVYVLPSDVEGMPLTLLEAMSYGNCCLVSNIEECCSVVEEHAIIFEKGNIDMLANQLQILCDDVGLVKEKKLEAEKCVLSKYDWESINKKVLEVYEIT